MSRDLRNVLIFFGVLWGGLGLFYLIEWGLLSLQAALH